MADANVIFKVKIKIQLDFVPSTGQIIIYGTIIKNACPQQAKVLLGPKIQKNSKFTSFHLSYVVSQYTAHPFP